MKSLINLETTSLEFPRVMEAHDETATLFHKGSLVRLPDFATVLVGWEDIEDSRWKASIVENLMLETRRAPIFTAPKAWKLAHILKALGAFESVGEARRNGWDKPVPEGMEDHVARIRKIKGAITTFRPPAAILLPNSWEACSREEGEPCR